MAENDGNEDSVMESLGADGKFACSRDATTYEGVTGEAVAFKVAPAATPTQLQQLDAFVGSTDMVGDMAMDAADLHKVGGADQEGYSTTESGAEAVSLGVVEMDGREEALVTPVKAFSLQAQGPSCHSSARRVGSLDEHSLARAQRLTAKRNLDQGTCSGSFFCLLDNHIIKNITNLGVILGNNDLAIKKVTREIRDFEHGRIANSPISNSKVKQDLMKDLDELDTLEDDGLDQVGLKDFNCDKLVDGPT